MDPIEALGLPPSRWVDVGGPVHYRAWEGPAAGPTFVCVHGLGGSLLNWAPVAPGLARHGRVIALDLAGFGLTPLEERGAGVGSNWKVLDGFLRTLDLPPVVLIGNSMGGMLALIQAAHAPQSVHSLVLVDAALPRTRTVQGQFDPRMASLFALYSTTRAGEWRMLPRCCRHSILLSPQRFTKTSDHILPLGIRFHEAEIQRRVVYDNEGGH